ncbi:MAG: hypothetical protein ACJAT2_001453 [Bacteriovoracaceae bacterium]|jgi:hypothetical protein
MNQVKIEYFKKGHINFNWEVPPSWKQAILEKDWQTLDSLAAQAVSEKGSLRVLLEKLCPVQKIEHLISLREAPDEDGIWHDDGSRDLAFSLSLSLESFEGEGLGLRIRGDEASAFTLGYRPYGTLTCFLTGSNGYEHRTHQVLKGSRLVLAGWVN